MSDKEIIIGRLKELLADHTSYEPNDDYQYYRNEGKISILEDLIDELESE